ncbi:MAG: hypothetical protein ACTH2Q_10910 [Propionibacteriaceae bacterium]
MSDPPTAANTPTDRPRAGGSPGVEESRWQLLDEHIRTARWFGGKGRAGTFTAWVPLPWLEPAEQDQANPAPDWPRVRSELVEVCYPGDETSEWYHLLLSHRGTTDHNPLSWIGDLDDPELGPVSVHDATADPEALTLVLRTLTTGVEAHSARARLTTRTVGTLPAPLVPRRFGGEQTNTSILYGDAAILKLFRRLEQGRNLDIEVHAALADSRSPVIADFHASAEAQWQAPDGRQCSADLAILIEQFAAARGGWEEALAACEADRDFSTAAHGLGAALAEVHRVLARHFPTTSLPGDALAAAMRLRLDTAIVEVPHLDPYGPGLRRCLDALVGHDWPAQRVHGDFHLGQALRVDDGWRIIDFEGEPLKTLAERARPDSRWRDVAGMLRSFDYAGGQVRAVRRAAALADDGPGDPTTAWVQSCRAAFLSGYAPDLDGRARAALRAYEADKAIYEVLYETRNRPDWAAIPLAAVATLSAAEPPNPGPSEEIR